MKNFVLLIALTASSALAAAPSKVLRHHSAVRDEYIVVLDEHIPIEGVDGVARSLAAKYTLAVRSVWPEALRGFLASVPEDRVELLAGDPRVAYLEQNVLTNAPNRVSASVNTWLNGNYLWHLDRLDELSYDNRDSNYTMTTEGRSTYAYVIDFGVYGGHQEFSDTPSRVTAAYNFANGANGATDSLNGCGTTGLLEDSFHGTAVASALAGRNVGASRAKLVSLRVYTCGGSFLASDLIDAFQWIINDTNPTTGDPNRRIAPRVINFSGYVPVWDSQFQSVGDAATNVVTTTNTPFFVSANNFNADACKFSPASRAYTRADISNPTTSRRLFSVGATTVAPYGSGYADYRWQYTDNGTPRLGISSGSNGGPCVSIFAPGQDIYVATNRRIAAGQEIPYGYFTGTSFSAPLAAGIAARYMERQQTLTGVIPGWREVYNFLLQKSQTTVQNTTTAPNHWMCAYVTAAGDHVIADYNYIGSCASPYTGPWWMQQVNNDTAAARMLFWDEVNQP